MPRDERYPTPLLNMSPSGWAGFGAVVVMCLGIWSLFGNFFLVGMAFMSVVAVLLALGIRGWRAKHPSDKSLLHLGSGRGNGKDADP
jgi:membrane protein implicated in regulation of membrane protease activity